MFIHRNNSPFSRNFTCKQLKSDIIDIGRKPDMFNTHSFRKGRATSLAEQGYTPDQIAMLGRWNSNAYKLYIEPSVIKFDLFFNFHWETSSSSPLFKILAALRVWPVPKFFPLIMGQLSEITPSSSIFDWLLDLFSKTDWLIDYPTDWCNMVTDYKW